MANSKINTILSFATAGTSGVKNDVKSVVGSVDGATSAVDKLSKKISSIQKGVAFQNVVTAAGAVKSAFSEVADIIGGTISSMYDLAASQAAEADKIGKTSALLGMQAEELQAIRSAGKHAGMTIETIDSAMQRFSVTTARAAAGEKQQIELFNALGVVTRNADGSIRNQTELLMDVADAYTKLTSVQDRNRVSQELFGRSAVQMSALLGEGAAGISSAVDQYKKTGAGYTQKQIDDARDFNDSLQLMQEYIDGVRRSLFFGVVPAFTSLFNKVSSFIDENRPQIDSIINRLSDKLPSVLEDVTDVLPTILSGVSMVASVVASIVDFTGPWVPLLTAASVLVGGAILTAVGAVGVAVSAVASAFGGVIVAAAPIVGVVAAVTAGVASLAYVVYEVYENFDMLKSFVMDDIIPAFISGIKQFANSAIEVFAMIADGIAKIPVIGKVAEGAGDWWRSQKFDVGSFPEFDSTPAGATTSSDVTGAAPVSTSSSLTVDFRGVPRGTRITPADNFDSTGFDYSAGYAFGG